MTYYPIVYAAGLTDERAQPYQHRWFLCDLEHRLLPKAQLKKLEQLSFSIFSGVLRIDGPGMLRLELLLDVIEDDDSVRCQAKVGEQTIAAIDEGELAHTWFSRFLGRDCYCLKVDPEMTKPVHWP